MLHQDEVFVTGGSGVDLLSPPQNLCKEYRTFVKFFRAAADFSLCAVERHRRERSEAGRHAVKRAERF